MVGLFSSLHNVLAFFWSDCRVNISDDLKGLDAVWEDGAFECW